MENWAVDKLIGILFFIVIFGCAILIKKCDEPRVKEEKENYKKQVEINKDKFYYPKYRDGYWHTYSANLIGSEGWVRDNDKCKNHYVDYRIVVLNQIDVRYYREEARKFKGRLIVTKKGEKKPFEIRFRCFKPDYNSGSWLAKNN